MTPAINAVPQRMRNHGLIARRLSSKRSSARSRSPAEGDAGAASDLAFTDSDTDAAVKNERAITGSQQIVGKDASRREADRVGAIETAPASAHGKVLTREQHWLGQRDHCGKTFGQLFVALPQMIDLGL